MEQSEYRKNAMQMIALVRCAVSGTKPSPELTAQLDLDALFQVCQSHCLTACTAFALEAAGVQNAAFREAKEKAVRKNILLDTDRRQIVSRLEAEQIWYLPLKGSLLKDWYPKLGMRQMSDNDILFDPAARERVREIMTELGFQCEHFGGGNNVDAYMKPPVSNFEMHVSLYKPHEEPLYDSYFSSRLPEMLLPDADSAFGRHLSPEDFYLYFLTHAYKHFHHGGTGVRTLLDAYIFLKRFGGSLDRALLEREMEKLSLTEYESHLRSLSEKLFTGETPDVAEQEILDYYLFSGTYGTLEHHTANQVRQNGNSKFRYLLRRIFPPMDVIRRYFPFFYRHKILIPVLWIIRPVRALFRKREQVRAELSALRKNGQSSPFEK